MRSHADWETAKSTATSLSLRGGETPLVYYNTLLGKGRRDDGLALIHFPVDIISTGKLIDCLGPWHLSNSPADTIGGKMVWVRKSPWHLSNSPADTIPSGLHNAYYQPWHLSNSPADTIGLPVLILIEGLGTYPILQLIQCGIPRRLRPNGLGTYPILQLIQLATNSTLHDCTSNLY